MKKIIIGLLFIINNVQSQNLVSREEYQNGVGLITSTTALKLEPFFSANAIAFIHKDTLSPDEYGFTFFYNAPEETTLDTNDIMEILFSDGERIDFNHKGENINKIAKDSPVSFSVLSNEDCVSKMMNVPILEITFTTPAYQHRIEIPDKMKLMLPNLVRYLLRQVEEEKIKIAEHLKSLSVPPIVFDARGNKLLNKKYYGKYSGEWNRDNYLYNFDLYIKSDTSYIVWRNIKNRAESDSITRWSQTLNIRSLTKNNILILDVCYNPEHLEYTNGRRTYYLKLSENRKVIYGTTQAFEYLWGEMYGLRKRKYRT